MSWSAVYITDMKEAQVIKTRFDFEGIPVQLEYEAVTKIYGFTMDGLGKVKVMVPGEYVERALNIIKDAHKGENFI